MFMAYNINICSKFRQKMIDLFRKNTFGSEYCKDSNVENINEHIFVHFVVFSSTPCYTQVVRMVLRMVGMVVP